MAKPEAPPKAEDVARALKRAVKANREATAVVLRYVERLRELGIEIEIVEEAQPDGTVAEERTTNQS